MSEKAHNFGAINKAALGKKCFHLFTDVSSVQRRLVQSILRAQVSKERNLEEDEENLKIFQNVLFLEQSVQGTKIKAYLEIHEEFETALFRKAR